MKKYILLLVLPILSMNIYAISYGEASFTALLDTLEASSDENMAEILQKQTGGTQVDTPDWMPKSCSKIICEGNSQNANNAINNNTMRNIYPDIDSNNFERKIAESNAQVAENMTWHVDTCIREFNIAI